MEEVKTLTRQGRRDLLTPGELEKLELTAHGLIAKQVADYLGITPGVVENALATIRTKLSAKNIAEAVRIATELKLLTPERGAQYLVLVAFDALNCHDADRFAATLHPDHVWQSETLPEPVRGRDEVRRTMERYWLVFPDLHFDFRPEDVMVNGNRVTVRWIATGTHLGVFYGVPPTGRQTEVVGSGVYVVEGSYIVRAYTTWNFAHLLEQIGEPIRGKYAP